jgi:hypothetical protein
MAIVLKVDRENDEVLAEGYFQVVAPVALSTQTMDAAGAEPEDRSQLTKKR